MSSHREQLPNRLPIEHDQRLVHGSLLAIGAAVVLALGIAYCALTSGMERTHAPKDISTVGHGTSSTLPAKR